MHCSGKRLLTFNFDILILGLETYYLPTMSPLEGKIAVVSGASRGLGEAMAFELAQDGASVSVHTSDLKP